MIQQFGDIGDRLAEAFGEVAHVLIDFAAVLLDFIQFLADLSQLFGVARVLSRVVKQRDEFRRQNWFAAHVQRKIVRRQTQVIGLNQFDEANC